MIFICYTNWAYNNIHISLFPDSRLFEIRNQRLLLDMFIQIGSRVVDTVPAGVGIIKAISHSSLLPSSLRTQSHPVVVVDQPVDPRCMGEWGVLFVSLLPLPSAFPAPHNPSPLPFLPSLLWLFSAPGLGTFLFIPSLSLACLHCLFLLRFSLFPVAPFLLSRVFPRLSLGASFFLRHLPCTLCPLGDAP